MTRCKGRLLLIGLTTFVLFSILTAVWSGYGSAVAYAQGEQPTLGTITVVGLGKVKVTPDVAQATIGVEFARASVKEASAETSQTMQSVLAALKAQGIDAQDIQTSGFTIWIENPYAPEGSQPKPLYHVTNQVSVTIRNLDKLGAVLDAAIEAGANSIMGISFSLADSRSAESEARQKALADAQAKAIELAQFSNLKLDRVVSISEVIGGTPFYGGGFVQTAAASGLGGGAPIVPGQLEVSLQLQVVYALE